MKIDSFRGRYRFLSNFHPTPNLHIHDDLLLFDHWPTAEHAYQAAKSTSGLEKEQIRLASSPSIAKQLGRQIQYMRPDWDEVKLSIMKSIVFEKFQSDESLASLLLNTGNLRLIEGNYWGDTFWGVCNGKGRNELGKILMDCRQQIREDKRAIYKP